MHFAQVFHAVHFEAPCDAAALQQYLTDQQNAMLIATHRQHSSAQQAPPQPQPTLLVNESNSSNHIVTSQSTTCALMHIQTDALVRALSNRPLEGNASSVASSRQSTSFSATVGSANPFSNSMQPYVAPTAFNETLTPFYDASTWQDAEAEIGPESVPPDDLDNDESTDDPRNRNDALANRDISDDT